MMGNEDQEYRDASQNGQRQRQEPRIPFHLGPSSQQQQLLSQHDQIDNHFQSALGSLGRVDRELELALLREQYNFQQELQFHRQRMREQHEQIIQELETYQHLVCQGNASQLQSPLLQHQQPFGLHDLCALGGQRLLQEDQAALLQRAALQQRALFEQRQMQEMFGSNMNAIPSQDQIAMNRKRSISSSSIEISDKTNKKTEHVVKKKKKTKKPKQRPVATKQSKTTTDSKDTRSNVPKVEEKKRKKGSHDSKTTQKKEKENESPSNILKDFSLLLSAAEDPKVKNISKDLYIEPSANGMDILASTASTESARNSPNNGTSPTLAEVALIIRSMRQHYASDDLNTSVSDESLPELESDESANVVEVEKQEIIPGFISMLPKLPNEPEISESDLEQLDEVDADKDDENSSEVNCTSQDYPKIQQRDKKRRKLSKVDVKTKDDQVITYHSLHNEIKEPTYSAPIDTWWPSNGTIEKEKRVLRNDTKKNTKEEEKFVQKMTKDPVPGVMQKLPHCKLHVLRYRQQKGTDPPEPMFCFQVTDAHCKDTMVCCSICSTWRHVACGGHYTWHTPKSCGEGSISFVPICDICHTEQKILQKYPLANKRIDRQRTEHLKRTQAVNAVMRMYTYAKHGDKVEPNSWPLGSVPATHIDSHIRNIQLRNEQAQKNWEEMSTKLNTGFGSRHKEKVTLRTREFERLALNLEDAETEMDLHNMILFLQNDLARSTPIGFENPHYNYFDPADDEYRHDQYGKGKKQASIWEEGSELKERNPQDTGIDDDSKDEMSDQSADKSSFHGKDIQQTNNKNKSYFVSSHRNKDISCLRSDCHRKARFDSVYCSDGCGVHVAESDLLDSFKFAINMHPHLLRR